MSEARAARRRAREQSSKPGLVDNSAGPVVPLEVMLDIPIEIEINDTTYEVRESPMRRLTKISEMLSKVPTILVARAWLPEDESTDIAKVTTQFNTLMGFNSEQEYDQDEVAAISLQVFSTMSEDMVETIMDLCVEIINTGKTKVDQVTEENFKDSLVSTDMVRILRAYFLKNTGYRQRF